MSGNPSHKKRRYSPRSLLGCLTCRRRRVKCDETNYPRCINCQRRRVECDWPPIYASMDEGGVEPVTLHLNTPKQQPIFFHDLQLSDLELFHHFTTSTIFNFQDVYGFEKTNVFAIYQSRIPRVALTHPFLMHALLSFGALHLHHLSQKGSASNSGRYYALSCYHRRHATQSYNPNRCSNPYCGLQCDCGYLPEAQFFTNLLLSLHAVCDTNLAIPRVAHPEVRIRHWLLKGQTTLSTLYATKQGQILVGPFSPASSQGQGPTVYFPTVLASTLPAMPPSFFVLSPLIYRLHQPNSGAPDDLELIDPSHPNTSQVYADCVHGLHVCYRLFFERHALMRVILAWSTFLLPPEWQKFCMQRRPRALIILVHLTILHRWCDYDGAMWWEGRAKGLVKSTWDILPTDEWRSYLEATLEYLGGVN